MYYKTRLRLHHALVPQHLLSVQAPILALWHHQLHPLRSLDLRVCTYVDLTFSQVLLYTLHFLYSTLYAYTTTYTDYSPSAAFDHEISA